MARRLRTDFAGAIQHVNTRGVARGPIYLANDERKSFLSMLALTVGQHRWTLMAYCLMTNHYHLLVRTEDANLAIGMKYLNGCHAQRFNRRHDRPGHLFGGRYWSTLIEDERQLVETGRYIALNPVRALLCGGPEQWPWSSYRATVGLERAPSFLDPGVLLGPFGATPERARQGFRTFVEDGLPRQPNVNGMLRGLTPERPEPPGPSALSLAVSRRL